MKRVTDQQVRQSRNDAAYFRGDVQRRANGGCEACGVFAPYIIELHHITPVSEGGGGTPDNLVALCPNCHAVIEKINTRLCELPPFDNWIFDHYGPDVYETLLAIAYREWKTE